MIEWRQFERGICLMLGSVHFLLGFVTLVGGRERFPSPGYTPLLDLSNGVVWPYGLMWMLGGFVMVVAKNNWRLAGVSIVVIIANLWAAMFAIAAFKDPHAPLTPVAAYGGYGLMNAVLAALIVIHWWVCRERGDGEA